VTQPEGDQASGVVSDYIKELVADEETRKTSLEQRGLAVVTTISAVVAVLFGFAAILPDSARKLPGTAHGPLVVALSFLVAGGVLGILATVPVKYRQVNAGDLEFLVRHWEGASALQGQTKVCLTRLDIYKRQLRTNGLKAVTVLAATVCEVCGIGFLAWAVGIALTAAK